MSLFKRSETLSDLSSKLLSKKKIIAQGAEHHKNKVLIGQAQEIIKQFKFFEIGKEQHSERLQHKLRHDPMLVYHTVLSNTRELTLPLISKVKNKKLILRDYTLDSGHMLGLAKAIKQTK